MVGSLAPDSEGIGRSRDQVGFSGRRVGRMGTEEPVTDLTGGDGRGRRGAGQIGALSNQVHRITSLD